MFYGVFYFVFFNLHLVFLLPPLPSPPQNIERIERDFNVLLLFILWMFSSGSACTSGRRNETFSKWRFLVGHADLWRALMYQTCHLSFSLNIFLLSLCSCTAVHMSNTVSFCLTRYKFCHKHLVQFSSGFVAWLGANCKKSLFFPLLSSWKLEWKHS